MQVSNFTLILAYYDVSIRLPINYYQCEQNNNYTQQIYMVFGKIDINV